ncbi:MAG: chromosome partitioning protein [Myxococcales bacterium]|nr:MAG: chromosome partitioning protein [Myxococcales bacterium]
MVIAFIHQKGGTGKSTLSVAAALWLARRGKRVLILDADSQGTSSTWGRRYGERYGVSARHQNERLLVSMVREFKKQFDHIVIDLPPTVTPQTEKAIEAADYLVIPMRASQADVWALDRLVALILVSDRKPAPPFKVVFTQCAPHEIAPFIGTLKTRKVRFCPTTIPHAPEWRALFDGWDLTPAMEAAVADLFADLEV